MPPCLLLPVVPLEERAAEVLRLFDVCEPPGEAGMVFDRLELGLCPTLSRTRAHTAISGSLEGLSIISLILQQPDDPAEPDSLQTGFGSRIEVFPMPLRPRAPLDNIPESALQT